MNKEEIQTIKKAPTHMTRFKPDEHILKILEEKEKFELRPLVPIKSAK